MNFCENCVLRLFNTKHHKTNGVGNPYFGNVIIVPNVDYQAYKAGDMGFSTQVDIIKEIISSSMGKLDNLFILPLIRCNLDVACKPDDNVYRNCFQYFKVDIMKYNFQKILLLGDASRLIQGINIKDNLNNIFISPNKRKYNVNYSPLIKYTNNDAFEIFKKYLLKWWNYCNNSYSNYNIIIL